MDRFLHEFICSRDHMVTVWEPCPGPEAGAEAETLATLPAERCLYSRGSKHIT